jgi:hypothetical protein
VIASLASLLGVLVMLLCGSALLRAYWRTRTRLLLWSGLCFLGLAASNVVAFLDMAFDIVPDLYPLRLLLAAGAMTLLMFGLVGDSE